MIRLQTGISVFNVIFAAARELAIAILRKIAITSRLAIAILRKNLYCQSTINSHSVNIILTLFLSDSFPAYKSFDLNITLG